MHLLVVEDDSAIRDPADRGLGKGGLHRQPCCDGDEALARCGRADLVLLDLGLPDMDGSELCRRVRADFGMPIIIVTARGDETERVLGLELGADDYIVKPFGVRELIARRPRRRPSNQPGLERRGSASASDTCEIDRRTRRVSIDGAEVDLAPKEFDLLALLGDDPGAVVSRQQIMDEVWDPHWYGPTKTLDVHIASLRKKLGDPTIVETVRSVGFRLRTRRHETASSPQQPRPHRVVLLAARSPLGLVYSRHEHDSFGTALQRDASSLATLSEEIIEHPANTTSLPSAHASPPASADESRSSTEPAPR